MTEKPDTASISPERLMWGFTRSRLVQWTLVAVAIHVVAIGTMSMGYIRDTWVDPEGAARRKADAEAAMKAQQEKAAAPAPATPTTKTGPKDAAPVKDKPADDRTLLEKHKDVPVVKRITDTAQTNEIPKQPDDLGISIKDATIR